MVKAPLVSIVDDDDSVREAVKSLIKSVGLAAETFPSAEDFLRSDYLRSTGCLILDLRMPGMSGLELQRRLSVDNYKIPIVFISAHGDAGEKMQALQAGAVDFLYKPFSENVLLKAVQSALKR
jgi:FixJ family two-component response regulator